MSIYTYYQEPKLHKRIRHLNNRDLAILFGVFLGMAVAIYGIYFNRFSNIPILGSAIGHKIWFKLAAIILSGGTFGNLLSYVGSCVDIITNHKTIFDLFRSPRAQ